MSSSLPLLLAGPCIRRASPTEIWFWIATSRDVKSIRVLLTAYSSRYPGRGRKYEVDKRHTDSSGNIPFGPHEEYRVGRRFFGNTDSSSVKLGENLFVSIKGVRPQEGKTFPTDVILGYDLEIEFESGNTTTTKKLADLVSDITYSRYPTPTFLLRSKPGVLAQASCRRPGASGPDACTALDSAISSMQSLPKWRAAALFLTGDQIYADDVAHSLYAACRQLSLDLMGYDEYMPKTWDRYGRYRSEVQAGDIGWHSGPVKQNRKWINKPLKRGTRKTNGLDHGFTTQDGEGHLLTFGEFAAMYLLVWNPDLAKRYGVERNLMSSGGQGDRNLRGFEKAARAIRRVMANTPTYMIFDDHEVTDDWNISAKWEKNTDNLYARRIIANALAAFWAFQGWGNDPGPRPVPDPQFGLLRTIEKHLEKQLKSKGKLYRFNDRDFGKPMLAYHEWSYLAPTNPIVVVADFRTHRDHARRWPSHIDDQGKRNLNLRGRRWKGPLVLVSASPMLPWEPMITARAAKMLTAGKTVALEYPDLWADSEWGLVAFIDHIARGAKPKALVVLSGDVHFSHITKGVARSRHGGSSGSLRWELPVTQITCSPLKNEDAKLTGKILGIFSKGNVAEEVMSTSGRISGYSAGDYVQLPYDAVKIKGKLGHDTVIARNQACVMDFSSSRRVAVEFWGPRGRAYTTVDITK